MRRFPLLSLLIIYTKLSGKDSPAVSHPRNQSSTSHQSLFTLVHTLIIFNRDKEKKWPSKNGPFYFLYLLYILYFHCNSLQLGSWGQVKLLHFHAYNFKDWKTHTDQRWQKTMTTIHTIVKDLHNFCTQLAHTIQDEYIHPCIVCPGSRVSSIISHRYEDAGYF